MEGTVESYQVHLDAKVDIAVNVQWPSVVSAERGIDCGRYLTSKRANKSPETASGSLHTCDALLVVNDRMKKE